MPSFPDLIDTLDSLVSTLAALGGPLEWLLLAGAVALAATALVPGISALRRPTLLAVVTLLGVGELLLVWFHWRLWRLAVVVEPFSWRTTGRIAVPLWVESEKLFVWALVLAVMAALARRHRQELFPVMAVMLSALVAGAVLWGRPFTEPLPGFLGQYGAYLQAGAAGDIGALMGLFQSLEGSRQFFYNTWYMWVHPPLLFASYGAFAMSFAGIVGMLRERRSAFEETAYRWARLGYLPLTFGMLLGFPWAILAWQGSAWWWSGKVNMSIMMWLMYTAYLHGRLYLRRRGMWRLVAALGVLAFLTLVATYVTTYLVPGAHSYA